MAETTKRRRPPEPAASPAAEAMDERAPVEPDGAAGATAAADAGAGSAPPDVAELGRLAELARAGDRDALRALLERYRPLLGGLVARFARGALPTGVDADDLAQEAARQLCELALAYDPTRPGNLTSYLQSKLKWRLANYLRGEARRSGHQSLEAAPVAEATTELVSALEVSLAGPRLARVLRRLSPRQRSVIAGLYWRERTTQELARELGVTVQAITALRRRAEATLRRELEEPPAR